MHLYLSSFNRRYSICIEVQIPSLQYRRTRTQGIKRLDLKSQVTWHAQNIWHSGNLTVFSIPCLWHCVGWPTDHCTALCLCPPVSALWVCLLLWIIRIPPYGTAFALFNLWNRANFFFFCVSPRLGYFLNFIFAVHTVTNVQSSTFYIVCLSWLYQGSAWFSSCFSRVMQKNTWLMHSDMKNRI